MKINNTLPIFIHFLLFSTFVTAMPMNILPINRLDTSDINYYPRDINILSVGDWGSAALGGYHLKNAENTANAMKIYASEYKPKLVLNTGDNFYYCGIQNMIMVLILMRS